MYAPVYRIYDNNRDITPTRWRQGALLKVSRRWRRGGVHRLLHAIEQAQRQRHRCVDGVGTGATVDPLKSRDDAYVAQPPMKMDLATCSLRLTPPSTRASWNLSYASPCFS